MNQDRDFYHVPVMLAEVLEILQPQSGAVYVDGTMGGAGHSKAILQASAPLGRLIAIDQDDDAIAAGKVALAQFGERVLIFKDNFVNLEQVVKQSSWGQVDGILLDIGVSSYQLDKGQRGFSYMQDAPLDMRMDQKQDFSAWDIVNKYSQDQLTKIIYQYGEEKWAKRIAQMILLERKEKTIDTTGQLVQVIKKAIPVKAREKDQHPAKRTFQAIRIAVNDELGVLGKAIDAAVAVLKPGGRLVIITFHSLEDRIVKEKFRLLAADCLCPPKTPICICGHQASIKLLSRKPILPQKNEIEHNPRSRSAKMRVAVKL
ncbi:MAG: 16S rRNA (cytosine(1402)-N(4))-methyltransferase RsmH [Bacillota bacterium]|jgi:16S rRNA (cytosine1402-N4)-methyltransferase